MLEWHAVEDGPFASAADAIAQHGGILLYNWKPLATRPAPYGQRAWYVLDRQPIVRGTDLRDARVSAGDRTAPATTFSLSQEAGKRFEQYTRSHIGSRSAIVLDQEISSAPVIEDAIRAQVIRGDLNRVEGNLAENLRRFRGLAADLEAGSATNDRGVAGLRTLSAKGFARARPGRGGGREHAAPSPLGRQRHARIVVKRRAPGGGARHASEWCSTLPGIAGVVLTIGMAVDSNVLIFERIREELRAGKSAAAGRPRILKAFATLVDTHVTTVVS